jgi:hypothetical protein
VVLSIAFEFVSFLHDSLAPNLTTALSLSPLLVLFVAFLAYSSSAFFTAYSRNDSHD